METKKVTKEYAVFSIENRKSENEVIYAMKQYFRYRAKHYFLVESAYYGRVLGLQHSCGLTIEKKNSFVSDSAVFFGMIAISPYSDLRVKELLGQVNIVQKPAPVVESNDEEIEDEAEMQVSDISATDDIEGMQSDLNSLPKDNFESGLMEKLNGMRTKDLKKEYGEMIDIKVTDSKTIIINKVLAYLKGKDGSVE